MITSASNSRVKQITEWQRSARARQEAGVFPAEGFKMFEEAPEDSLLEVYLSESAWHSPKLPGAVREKLERVGYELVSDDILNRMSDTRTPQGLVFAARQPKYDLGWLLARQEPLLVALEDIQDPGNLGTIVRSGEAAGITGVIMCGRTADLFNPKTVRATMGSVFRVPCVYADSMREVIPRLHEKGIHTYAAHLAGDKFYDSLPFSGGTAFLIGNEGSGLCEETARMAEVLVRIPMEGRVESLNAAVAASLLMYSARRTSKPVKDTG